MTKKKCQVPQKQKRKARKGHAFRCGPLFPACVTCCRWAASLDLVRAEWLSRLTQVWSAHEGRISPRVGSLSSLWLSWGWAWKACKCHADPQDLSHLHRGLSVTSGHVSVCTVYAINRALAYVGYTACKTLRCDWLAGICVLSHNANSQSFSAN